MQKERQSNFELLRVVLMFLIVAHHYAMFSGFAYSDDHFFNKIFLLFFGSGGKIGVSVFVMISGYFLIQKGFSLRKLGRFIVQVWGYSLAMVALVCGLGIFRGTSKELIEYLLPFGYMSWFAHTYLLLFFLTPFLNTLFKNLERPLFQKFLLLGFTLWYLIPTVAGLAGMRLPMGTSILMDFIFLYGIGAYIGLYGEEIHVSHALGKAVGLYVAIVFLDIFFEQIHWELTNQPVYFAEMNSALMLAASVYLFLAFKQLRMGYSPLINKVAATTFGVYLIHDNDLFRLFLWQEIYPFLQWYDSPLLPLYSIVAVAIVFYVCSFIDFHRVKFLEPRYSRWVDRLVGKWEK